MRSLNIFHVSDLHLNLASHDDSLDRIYKLFSEISKRRFHHLIISGDITDNASETEFSLLKELLDACGLLDPQRTTIIPGNHDLFGGVHKLEDILRLPERWRSVHVEEALNKFVAVFSELFEGVKSPEGRVFPFIKPINNAVIVGINSLMPFHLMKNPMASNGTIAIEQLVWLTAELPEYEHLSRIFVTHHHFNKILTESNHFLERMWLRIEKQTMKLYNKKQILRILKDLNPLAVLHGHYHFNEVYYRKGIRFINAGATLKNPENTLYYYDLAIEKNTVDVNKMRIPIAAQNKKKTLQQYLGIQIHKSAYPVIDSAGKGTKRVFNSA